MHIKLRGSKCRYVVAMVEVASHLTRRELLNSNFCTSEPKVWTIICEDYATDACRQALFFVGVCVEYSSGLFLNLFGNLPIFVPYLSFTHSRARDTCCDSHTNAGLSAPALASSSAAFLWAVHAMHYKGELLLRLMLAAAIFALLASLPSTPAPVREGEAVPVHESACAVLLFAAALGVRGGIAAWLAVSKGRWHRWLI